MPAVVIALDFALLALCRDAKGLCARIPELLAIFERIEWYCSSFTSSFKSFLSFAFCNVGLAMCIDPRVSHMNSIEARGLCQRDVQDDEGSKLGARHIFWLNKSLYDLTWGFPTFFDARSGCQRLNLVYRRGSTGGRQTK